MTIKDDNWLDIRTSHNGLVFAVVDRRRISGARIIMGTDPLQVEIGVDNMMPLITSDPDIVRLFFVGMYESLQR